MWETPEGNLAATLLVVLKDRFTAAATLGFVAGLALSGALDAVAPGKIVRVAPDGGGAGRNRFELKWPNDVLAEGAKLAGILLESSMLPNGQMAVAIGIGGFKVLHHLGNKLGPLAVGRADLLQLAAQLLLGEARVIALRRRRGRRHSAGHAATEGLTLQGIGELLHAAGELAFRHLPIAVPIQHLEQGGAVALGAAGGGAGELAEGRLQIALLDETLTLGIELRKDVARHPARVGALHSCHGNHATAADATDHDAILYMRDR